MSTTHISEICTGYSYLSFLILALCQPDAFQMHWEFMMCMCVLSYPDKETRQGKSYWNFDFLFNLTSSSLSLKKSYKIHGNRLLLVCLFVIITTITIIVQKEDEDEKNLHDTQKSRNVKDSKA